jgi:hypothetical protein
MKKYLHESIVDMFDPFSRFSGLLCPVLLPESFHKYIADQSLSSNWKCIDFLTEVQ